MAIEDLINDWKTMRTMLERQLAMLMSGQMRTGDDISDSTTKATIARIEAWLAELKALQEEYGRHQS